MFARRNPYRKPSNMARKTSLAGVRGKSRLDQRRQAGKQAPDSW